MRWKLATSLAALLLGLPMLNVASGQTAPESEIAPKGKLRTAAIGIRVLGGVGGPVGKFIAQKIGVPYQPVVYHNPDAYEQSFGKGEWDIAIGPRVLAPPAKADVSEDVWVIDLQYLASSEGKFASPASVDRAGVKVGTIQNSPSDRFLTRSLKFATLVRLPLTPNFPADAIDLLRSGKADVFGADAGLIGAITGGYPGAKIIPGAFGTVRVAVALPKGLPPGAMVKLGKIISEAKRTGIVRQAIEEAGLKGGVHVASD